MIPISSVLLVLSLSLSQEQHLFAFVCDVSFVIPQRTKFKFYISLLRNLSFRALEWLFRALCLFCEKMCAHTQKKSEKSPLSRNTQKRRKEEKRVEIRRVLFSFLRKSSSFARPIARDCSGLSSALLLFALLIRTTRLKKER